MTISKWSVAILIFFVSTLANAGSPFTKVDSSVLPLINPEGDLAAFQTALSRQIAVCKTQNLNETFQLSDRTVTRRTWCLDTAKKMVSLAHGSKTFAEFVAKAKTAFSWYQSIGNDGQGKVLFTGYNFPVSQASLTPTGEFQFPLYLQPSDLVHVSINGKLTWAKKNADGSYSPYEDRKAIDGDGALKGRGLEAAYLNDEFSAYLYQIEGSGAVMIPQADGTQKRMVLNYVAQNGLPYVSIGHVLKLEGVPAQYLSIPGMRLYFQQNPGQLWPTLFQDPSYVFFQQAADGPYGSSTALLTAKHSVAVDQSVFPMGATIFFQTNRPEMDSGAVKDWKDFSTMAVTQDTGGAIIGPGHIDIYWGEDQYAEDASGLMEQNGTLYLAVLPKAD